MMGEGQIRNAYRLCEKTRKVPVTILGKTAAVGRTAATAKVAWQPVARLKGILFRRRDTKIERGPGGERGAHNDAFKFSSPFPVGALPIEDFTEMRLVAGYYEVGDDWNEEDEYAIGLPEVGDHYRGWQTIVLPLTQPARGKPKPAGVVGS